MTALIKEASIRDLEADLRLIISCNMENVPAAVFRYYMVDNLAEGSLFIIYYIINKGLGIDAQKKTFTHEVGHALGWFGHSAGNTDVMYAYGSQYLYLTMRDKNHLCQIY